MLYMYKMHRGRNRGETSTNKDIARFETGRELAARHTLAEALLCPSSVV
jgi:hypothetical protein